MLCFLVALLFVIDNDIDRHLFAKATHIHRTRTIQIKKVA